MGSTLVIRSFNLKEIEKKAIREVLDRVDFNKSTAARKLGISYNTLVFKIRRYGIKDPVAPLRKEVHNIKRHIKKIAFNLSQLDRALKLDNLK